MVNKVKEGPFDKRLKALLSITDRNKKKFEDAEAKIRIYPKKSTAVPTTKVQELNSISSPLVEKSGSRIYYDEEVLWDSSGYFSFVYAPLRQVTFVDQKGQEVVFEFLDPTPEG